MSSTNLTKIPRWTQDALRYEISVIKLKLSRPPSWLGVNRYEMSVAKNYHDCVPFTEVTIPPFCHRSWLITEFVIVHDLSPFCHRSWLITLLSSFMTYHPFVIIHDLSPFCHRSWLITGFAIRVRRRTPLV